jgi:hypothetical protein
MSPCDSSGDEFVTTRGYIQRVEAPGQPLTFVVRLTVSDGGRLSGVVERVRSREKQRFHGLAALAEVIAGMVEREAKPRRRAARER